MDWDLRISGRYHYLEGLKARTPLFPSLIIPMINLSSVSLLRVPRLYRDQCLRKPYNNLTKFLFYAKRRWKERNSSDKEKKKIKLLNRSFKSYNNI